MNVHVELEVKIADSSMQVNNHSWRQPGYHMGIDRDGLGEH